MLSLRPHACPICGYRGRFRSLEVQTGSRRWAECPRCGSYERHRLQKLVMDTLSAEFDFKAMRLLHVAPEPALGLLFKTWFRAYETADIETEKVDHKVDLRSLPFADRTYDVVYASHVLEHIDDDEAALLEIRRVLAPGGFAVLPVPIVVEETIEYPEPNPLEHYHVRAPGPDYYERYQPVFDRVRLFRSGDFDARYQVYVHEDRTKWPEESAPLRLPMDGEKHEDVVAVGIVDRTRES